MPDLRSDDVLPNFAGKTVLVVGDVMLDRYWHGESLRISQEAPVPVVHFSQSDDRPGGAANVALNVASLGARCVLVGAIGQDESGAALRRLLQAAGVELDLLEIPDWPTITKLRVIARRQQLIRLDFEAALAEHWQQEILAKVEARAGSVHCAVLEDYDKGTLNQPERVVAALRQVGCPVVVDPKHKPLDRYRGATLIKPNLVEFERAAGASTDDSTLARLAAEWVQRSEVEAILVTRGERGMSLVGKNSVDALHLPAHKVEVFDVTGAGDTVAATLAASIAAGYSLPESARFANVAAGIAVTHAGTVAVTQAELRRALRAEHITRGRVLSLAQLQRVVDEARRDGERIVFTNGCFDILHAGHVRYLEQAKSLGNRLIVAVNDDPSVTRLKGRGRPINGVEHRMSVLAALSAVDWVTSFTQDTPEVLLATLQPEVLVKGGDYGLEQVVGADIVKGYGGEVKVLGVVEGLSTTAILQKLKP